MTEKQFRENQQQQSQRKEEQNEQISESFGGNQAALITAMLEAAGSFECSQLTEELFYSAASDVGNQTLLTLLASAEAEDSHKPVSAILSKGAELPYFEQDAPVSEARGIAFEAVNVPGFYFSGGQAVQFSDVQQMAIDITGV